MDDATTQTLQTPGSQDLPTFQTAVQQQEQIFGPLTALSSASGNNVMTFTIGTSPDNNHLAQLAPYTGTTPPAKPGFAVVCTGSCLVSNAVQQIVAYRATP